MKFSFATVTALLLALLVTPHVQARDAESMRRIVVTGEGSAAVAPDMAVLNLSVMREAPTAREALSANSEAMAKVVAAMKRFAIEDRDLQTSGFNIQPRYVYSPKNNGGQSRKLTGYTVRNSLTVRVRDIERVGEVLDTSVTLGVNEGGSVTFTNADPSDVIREARIAAVKDARDKAQTLAQAADVRLGPLQEMSEQSHNPGPMPVMRAEMSMAARDGAVPIAQGENSYQVQVHLTFAIDD